MSRTPIRYSRLGYVALQVTDLAASLKFYVDCMGLMLARQDAHCAWLRCSDKPQDLVLKQGPIAGLTRVGFELENRDELPRAFTHLAALQLHPAWSGADDLAACGVEAAFRFRNPDTGLELDFYAGQARAPTAFVPSNTQIARLGHVVLNVQSYRDAQRFWVDQLGFAISDTVPGRIAFLRCFPNRLHHSLALLTGEADGLNHINFMVTDIDDIGRAMNRMKKLNIPIVFGPGRHLPSGSIFLYFLDPDGMTAEFSFGMEEIAEHGGRAARELQPQPEVLDTWGSIPDPRFGKAGVIVNAAHG
jgi:2,3-dihydroxy-p-cumate/2,3-dihydroxybenzoate 3,4-dioxygenase